MCVGRHRPFDSIAQFCVSVNSLITLLPHSRSSPNSYSKLRAGWDEQSVVRNNLRRLFLTAFRRLPVKAPSESARLDPSFSQAQSIRALEPVNEEPNLTSSSAVTFAVTARFDFSAGGVKSRCLPDSGQILAARLPRTATREHSQSLCLVRGDKSQRACFLGL